MTACVRRPPARENRLTRRLPLSDTYTALAPMATDTGMLNSPAVPHWSTNAPSAVKTWMRWFIVSAT
jgi:hypothetical protein